MIEPLNLPDHWTNKKPDVPDQEHTMTEFQRCCLSGQQLFQRRNAEYNSAFRRYGLLGVVFEILGILNRLPPMTIWRNGDPVNVSKLRDLFLDLHNYSNMALMLLEDNNWDGKTPIQQIIREGETRDKE